MRRSPLLFLLFVLLAGCLEFDAQDVTIVYDAKADRIDAHFVYRGLFVESGSGSTDKPMEKAMQDLAKVRDCGIFYFWCNWPFSVDLTDSLPLPLQGLAAHVDVENGALFTDANGLLCAHQFVRVRQAKAFVQKLNTLLQLAVETNAASPLDSFGPAHTLDEDTQDLLREFFRSGNRMLQVEPGRIEVRLPCSTADHVWLKGQIERRFLHEAPGEMLQRRMVQEHRATGGDPNETSFEFAKATIDGSSLAAAVQGAPSFRFFWDNELSIVREKDITRIALGVKGEEQLVVRKASDGLWHDSFAKALRDKGETIEERVPEEELVRRFALFRARDPVLPKQLAALRKAAAPAAPAGTKDK